MASTTTDLGQIRLPLSRDRILRAAVELADDGGIESVTMRRLGQALGVEAMSLYHHVASKDDVLDGMVDVLVGDIAPPAQGSDWRTAIRERAQSARRLLAEHPWAPRLITSRSRLSPAILRYMDGVMGSLLAGGLSSQLAHLALHVIGSRVLGFTQELFDPTDLGPEVAKIFQPDWSGQYHSLASVLHDVSHDDDAEFEFGLDLILDGLERVRTSG
jgi:AcrR family transcriptional regulator